MTTLVARVPPVPLSSVRICAQGPRLVVDDVRGRWEPSSGQLHLPFDLEAEAAAVGEGGLMVSVESEGPTNGSTMDGEVDSDCWFERGLTLEEGDPLGARAAYREAIALDPTHVSAHANLGRLLHQDGSLQAAESHYRQALTVEVGNATAAFNLGVVLEDLGNGDGALRAYLQALDSDPELASAHFNAARLLEACGKKAEALGHLVAYRRLEAGG